ncbi:MAG: WbuC family cupin fold metalloprotein [Elusimicrobiota bacterium]
MNADEPDIPPGLDLIVDRSGRTEAYYSRSSLPVIDAAAVEWLKNKAAAAGTARICLHLGKEDPIHSMIIAHAPSGAFVVHKHLTRDEVYHMIEGRLRVTIYGEDGKPCETKTLGALGSGLPFLCRVRAGAWHSNVPEDGTAVFHESRPGPFKPADTLTADRTS